MVEKLNQWTKGLLFTLNRNIQDGLFPLQAEIHIPTEDQEFVSSSQEHIQLHLKKQGTEIGDRKRECLHPW